MADLQTANRIDQRRKLLTVFARRELNRIAEEAGAAPSRIALWDMLTVREYIIAHWPAAAAHIRDRLLIKLEAAGEPGA